MSLVSIVWIKRGLLPFKTDAVTIKYYLRLIICFTKKERFKRSFFVKVYFAHSIC